MGMGAVCSLGGCKAEISAALHSGARPHVSAREIHPQALDYPFFAARMDRRSHSAADTLRLARQAAREAIAQAGWEDLRDCAVIVGTTSGSALHFLESYRAGRLLADGQDYLNANPALELGRELAAGGPLLTISNACASGTDAIGLGLDMIGCGLASRVLCGGADAFSLVAHTGFARLMLSDKDLCRPFDERRKGLNLGEGAAFFCLAKDSDSPLGFVAGYGSAVDAWHPTAPHPEGRGLTRAIRSALGNFEAGNLAFVNAHGTATRENDKMEGQVLARELPDIPIWASKGQTGHCLGAAGALEALFAMLALREKMLPASQGFEQTDPQIGASPATSSLPLVKKAALSLSVGFGGGNSALLVTTA